MHAIQKENTVCACVNSRLCCDYTRTTRKQWPNAIINSSFGSLLKEMEFNDSLPTISVAASTTVT